MRAISVYVPSVRGHGVQWQTNAFNPGVGVGATLHSLDDDADSQLTAL